MDPLTTLKKYWGYDSFRPFQEQIVRSLMAGKDTCVVMPTGGGKSLCYQLPAAMAPDRTGIVISPLIALMQDQVAQLGQMGIPAAVLNSMLPGKLQGDVIREAVRGRYRLLYLSPERLARADTVAWLERVPVAFFAIDEAHCISEWGHEFRPEYRQLSRLKEHFPERPIAAFTASATRRVRHDIIEQLRLSEPDKYIASFHRSNLHYVVRECSNDEQDELLLKALQFYGDGNVIVYAPTIKRVTSTVAFLEDNGIRAVGYHGKMDAVTRRRNQERWTSDEVRVLVGTIAFGLGINKAAVRAVIHLSLPKSIEQFYQEAGRAGRDGHSSDCVLLWGKQNIILLKHFIRQMGDEAEAKRSSQRLDEILDFVERPICRHREICLHFGETPRWSSCKACDACGYLPEWLAQPRPERAREKEKKFKPSGAVRTVLAGVDAELADYIREWRREASKREGVPAFVIMHDSSLEDLCRKRPRTLAELRQVSGFGERKTAVYGSEILAALERFAKGARASQIAMSAQKAAMGTGKNANRKIGVPGKAAAANAS
jgi:ATP-dependent DNA helicase RecQ